MKTIFIINPRAGQGKKIHTLIEKIKKLTEFDSEIYITKAVGDATSYVRAFCEKFGAARFIACGGDGTLNEVLNGAIGCTDAEIGVIPVGTGNDFCRNFGEESDFHNVLSQITGKSVMCDAIQYKTVVDSETRTGYCANMFNIGFDCNVADLKGQIEKNPLIPGAMSYLVSIFAMLVRKKGANVRIEMDGREQHNGKLLLTSIANGCYCGGGIKSNPIASVNDGLININIVKNVSRLKFLSLLPHYMKGNFLNLKNIDKVILSEKCSRVKLIPLSDKIRLCVDGEIIDGGETEFEICHNAFRFVLPSEQNASEEPLLTKQA